MIQNKASKVLTKRNVIFMSAGVPIVALLAILTWASAQTGGQAVSMGVNNEFGEVLVSRERAPDFELDLLNGGDLRLSDWNGKIVLVDFWASWCQPCRQEAQNLAQVYSEYLEKPVEFIGVDIWDDPVSAQQYLEQFQVPYPNGIDSAGSIAIAYGVRGIPEKYFIAPDGTIAKKFVGPIKSADLREVLNDLLAGRGTPK